METTVDGSGRVFPIVQGTEIHTTGLTKRELFSAMAMQGLIMACDKFDSIKDEKTCAKIAVSQADALIKELNKTK